MGYKKSSLSKKSKEISVDTKSGSRSFNRFEMQISQTLHMAIELYPDLNYLFILDYYDDITLFDDDKSPKTVSYYQMKTSEEPVSINTAISKDWIAKMYKQMDNPEWLIKEIGLITNSALKMSISQKDSAGKTKKEEYKYDAEKTKFSSFNPITVNKIKEDIASKFKIDVNDVDLSKFVHMRTTLSISKHREIVSDEMNNLLQNQYPRITLDAAKAIFSSMIDILTRCQQYELLNDNLDFNIIKQHKGISKEEFSRIIDNAMIISIPEFKEIESLTGFSGDEKYKASYAYTQIMADYQSKSESFIALFNKCHELYEKNPKTNKISLRDYADGIYKLIPANPIYDKMYITILVACMCISEWRRSL